MNVVNKILAPTDLSDSSILGVRYALEMAAAVNAKIIIYHVAHYESDFPYPLGIGEPTSAYLPPQSFDEFMRDRRQALNLFVEKHFIDLTPQIDLSLETDIGSAQEQILQKAQEAKIDMIVMSTHGRTGLSHILIGSVTEYIVRRAPCPVLSIPSIAPST